jgi:hypothetical protein
VDNNGAIDLAHALLESPVFEELDATKARGGNMIASFTADDDTWQYRVVVIRKPVRK